MKDDSGIVLASASPRRSELLASVGLRFAVVPSRAPEDILTGETAVAHVKRLSLDKACEVAKRSEVPGRWFIGSDTVVVRDGDILGKPSGSDDAARMLRSLAGRSHTVVSGFAIVDRRDETRISEAVQTTVRFRELTEAEIAGYIATGEPFGKAGAYAIQGIGAFMVRSIEGSYTSVVGLPLCETIETLQRLGAIRLFDEM
ncbi:MAG: Maf family nucleotide pyrophosphatase [Desulfuromonadales bacterium]